jgi:hypothetical protein
VPGIPQLHADGQLEVRHPLVDQSARGIRDDRGNRHDIPNAGLPPESTGLRIAIAEKNGIRILSDVAARLLPWTMARMFVPDKGGSSCDNTHSLRAC